MNKLLVEKKRKKKKKGGGGGGARKGIFWVKLVCTLTLKLSLYPVQPTNDTDILAYT